MMSFRRYQEGQGLVDYSLILMLIAVVLIVVLVLYGDSLADYYQFIIDELPF